MESPSARRVLLVGWDSADWRVINPLLDAGKMPHLQRLVETGVMGNMATLYPILSPMLWTSIATGKRAHKHGIYGFAEPDPEMGGVRPITNLSRKTKAVWNILSQNEKKCIVLGWWPSHPAEPLPNGVMVSNHYQRAPHNDPARPWPIAKGMVHPERLAEVLGEIRLHPGELLGEHILPFVPKAAEIDQTKDLRLQGLAKTLADCTNIQAAATSLIPSEPWDFMAVYFDAIDHFGHAFMRYHPPRQKSVSKEDFEMYRGVIEAAYRYHDLMLGVLMAMAGPDTTVMLISDHGFHPDHLRPRAIPSEPAGPAVEHRHYGIFALAGPGLRQDERVYGATVLDVCPTLLTLFELPVGEDMDGKALVTAWETPPQIATVPSWDGIGGNDGRHGADVRLGAADSGEAIKQLEDLGYIQPLPADMAEAVAETERELQYNLACSYTDSQMIKSAAKIFGELWERWPQEHRFGVKLLSCELALGQVRKARASLDMLRRRQKDYGEEAKAALKKLAAEWKGRKPEDFQPHERAKAQRLQALANVPPGSAKPMEAALLLAEGRAREARGILAALEKAGKASPDFHLRMAHVHRALKQLDGAEISYKKALKLDPDNAHAHLGLAQVQLARRRNYEAAGHALTATGLLYHYPAAHFTLGVALHRLGFLDRAVTAFHVCLSQNPNVPAAHRRLALIYQNRLGDPSRAEEHRRKLQELASRAQKTHRAVSRDGKGPEPSIVRARGIPHVSPPVIAFDPAGLPAARSDAAFATIVTGLPRSGTSLMMQMLGRGGLPVLHDDHRPPDEDNPRGYFEFASAKNLRADRSWLPQAQGRALKLVAQLVPFLPQGQNYRLIFMERSLDEVLSSQRAMLARLGRDGAGLTTDRLKAAYERQLALVNEVIERQKLPVLRVGYLEALLESRATARRIADFLSLPLDLPAMETAVDPSLYRQKRRLPVRNRHE